MPFVLIKGTFHVAGYSPDGDSIRFRADNPEHWRKLKGPLAKLNARSHAQLRLEGIDTLETHYEDVHQPLQFARAATQFLLDELGIRNVQLDPSGIRVVSAEDGTRGFIVAREVEKNRRPVAFAYAGDIDRQDGSDVFLDVDLLRRSLNHASLRAGLAYATFYQGLFPDLRDELTAAVSAARSAGRGLWPQDQTHSGFDVPNLNVLTEDVIILPKLFRRIVSYLQGGGSMDRFKAFLAMDPDPILILRTGHFTNLDTIVTVNGNRVSLDLLPEEVVFIPRPDLTANVLPNMAVGGEVFELLGNFA
jgi:endonuclease YncB( thermonuclease family)